MEARCWHRIVFNMSPRSWTDLLFYNAVALEKALDKALARQGLTPTA
jgi:hypothetical protein